MKKLLLIGILFVALSSCIKNEHEELRNAIECLEDRVKEIEKQIAIINSSLSNVQSNVIMLQNLYKAIEARDYVTQVIPTSDGYTIMFAKGNPIQIKHGINGKDGSSSVISVLEQNGQYYWTINGLLILDNQNKPIPVNIKPELGQDSNGNITITIGGSTTTITNNISVEPVITNITQDNKFVYINLPSGECITVPKAEPQESFTFNITITTLTFNNKEVKNIPYTSQNLNTIVFQTPNGWKAEMNGSNIRITACDATVATNQFSGSILCIGLHSDGRSITRTINVSTPSLLNNGNNNNNNSGNNSGNDIPLVNQNPKVGDIWYWESGAMMGVIFESTNKYITIVHINGPVRARFVAQSNLTILSTSTTYGMDGKSVITHPTYWPAWNYCISQTGGDWYLPSWNEMYLIYNQRSTLNNVLREKLLDAKYWTSTLQGAYGYTQYVYPTGTQNLSTEAYIIPVKRIYID